jgi:hypothetical protein
MWAAPDVGQIIPRILTIKPLCNYGDSLRVISRHRTRGHVSHPMVATLRNVRKVSLRVVAMLPKTICDGWTRTGRGRHDGQPLPIVHADLHIRVIAARLVAIIPDGPRPRLACSTVVGSGRPTRRPRRDRAGIGGRAGRIGVWSLRPGRVGKTNDYTASTVTAGIATPATASMMSAMPGCLTGIVSRGRARHRGTKIRCCCRLQEEYSNSCYRCGLAHFMHLSRGHSPVAILPNLSNLSP